MTNVETILIEKRSGVAGGKAVIRGTRIPVWVVVESRKYYASLEDMAVGFPSAGRAGLEAALAYYDTHRDEIDAQIARAAVLDVSQVHPDLP